MTTPFGWVQSATSFATVTTGTTNSQAYPANNTAGNIALIQLSYNGSPGTCVVIDTQGNTYKRLGQGTGTIGGGANPYVLELWVAFGIKAGANTVNVTYPATITVQADMSVHEYSGPSNVQIGPSASLVGSGTAVSTGPITSPALNCMAVGYQIVDNTTTVTSPWTQRLRSGGGGRLVADDISSTGGTFTGQGTQVSGATNDWTIGIGILYDGSGIGGARPSATRLRLPQIDSAKGPIAVLGMGLLAVSPVTTSPISATMGAVGGMSATISASLSDAGDNLVQNRVAWLAYSPLLPPIAVLGVGVMQAGPVSTALADTMNGVGALTGTLTGAGALSDTMAGVGALTASLAATGALSDTMNGVGALSASLTGAGALSDTMAAVGALSATLTGAGALSDTMAATGALTASLAGAGALSDTMTGVGTFSAALAGTLFDVGPLKLFQRGAFGRQPDAVIGPIARLGSGLLQPIQPPASGAMTDAMNGIGAMTATLAGTGALADPMASVGALTASLGGSGALSDTMASVGGLTATLTGQVADAGASLIATSLAWRPYSPIIGPLAQLGSGLLQATQPVPSGFMTLTMNAIGGMSETLLGSGALTDTMAATAGLTASIGGAGALSDTMAAIGGLTASLSISVADSGRLSIFQRAFVQPGRVVDLSTPVLPIARLGFALLQPSAPPPPGPIVATMAGVGGLTETLVGSGALASTLAGAGALTATMASAGALADIMAAVGALSPNLGGGSSVSDTMAAIGTLSGAVLGSGAMISTQAAIGAFSAVPQGAGVLAATLSATGGLIAAGSVIMPISVTMAGVGGMSGFISGFPAGADSLRFRIAPPRRSRFKPGQSFRASVLSTSLGVLTDPPGLTATMYLPDKTTTVGVVVRESLGQWHADFLIPFTTPPGIGFYRWRSIGAVLGDNVVAESFFIVEPLDF